jgi:hypothetical protein
MGSVRGFPSWEFWGRTMFIEPNKYKNISVEMEYSS